jgi:hypothetical protein
LQAFRISTQCTILRTRKIIDSIKSKNDQLLLSGV